MAKIRVTQIRSVVGIPELQRRTIRALGLKRIRDSVVQEDRPDVRGMIARVSHLVEVEGVQGGSSPSEAKGSADPLAEGRRHRRRTEEDQEKKEKKS